MPQADSREIVFTLHEGADDLRPTEIAGERAFRLYAARDAEIAPGGTALVGCGVAVEAPDDVILVVQTDPAVAPWGLFAVNAPPRLPDDPSVRIYLQNTGSTPVVVRRGWNIARLLVLQSLPVGYRFS